MTYIDAFVVSVSKDKVESYRAMLAESAALWRQCGALSYVEALADDVPHGEVTSFPRAVQATDDELVVLSWVTWPSRSARDVGNKKVMADPRMTALMEKLPVDGKRMIFGGFETMIEA
jgi:uncharacterized protein YbaA (DUF1428 family)